MKTYTKEQILEAIAYWKNQLESMNEEETLIDESFKNTILGWVGIRSNNTKIEDLIDAYCKDPKHAERKNRPLLKKLMTDFLKDKNVNAYKNELLKKSVDDHNVEASYNELHDEIAMALRKMISAERYRKNKNRYEIAVRLITNALLAMLAPRLMTNARAAYKKYTDALAKAEEEWQRKHKNDGTVRDTTHDSSHYSTDPAHDEYANYEGHKGNLKTHSSGSRK